MAGGKGYAFLMLDWIRLNEVVLIIIISDFHVGWELRRRRRFETKRIKTSKVERMGGGDVASVEALNPLKIS